MKFLVIGDFHIPERANKIPEWIIGILNKECGKEMFSAVLCTGDLTDKRAVEELARFGPVKCVRGNMDYLELPEKALVAAGNFQILLLHGTGISPRGDIEKLNLVRKMENADIVVHGHTHRMGFDKIDDNGKVAIFVNPGTATGVWGGSSESTSQTFAIMEIENENIFIRFFENGKINKEVKLCIRKKR